MNWPLFIFDFILLLPFTMIRLILIYMFGSRYNIKNWKIFDVLIHAESPYFNQTKEQTVDTIYEDIRMIINNDTLFDNVYPAETCDNYDISNSDLFVKNNEDKIKINQENKIFKTYIDTITEIDTDGINSEQFNNNYLSDTIVKQKINVNTDMVDNVIINALKELDSDTLNGSDESENVSSNDMIGTTDMVNIFNITNETEQLMEISDLNTSKIKKNQDSKFEDKLIENSFIDTSTDEEKENVLVEINTDCPLYDD